MSVDVKLIEVINDGSGGATSVVRDSFVNVPWPGVIPDDGSSFPPTQYQPDPNHVSWTAVWQPYSNAFGSQVEEWSGAGSVKRIHIQNQLD
jgi:hypothetical protein